MIRSKIEQSVSILKELDIDLWLTFVRETGVTPDPVISYTIGTGLTWPSAFIITKSGETIAIVGSIDTANIEIHGDYQKVIGYKTSIKEDLLNTLRTQNPNKIAINYSTSVPAADGLTTGMYKLLLGYLEGTPFTERLISSEPIINALRGRKTAQEIEYMKKAIEITLEIFYKTSDFICPGKTEKEIAQFMLDEVERRGLETAWDREHCPAVFSGPDTAGAHAAPTDRPVEPGHLVNIDFGVKYNGYCADLQRTWYVLREGETQAPPEVQHGFDTLYKSIQLAKAVVRPGVQGKDVDHAARQHLIDNGYEGYPHGLGHQVGREAHDGGALLGPDWERYGNTPFLPLEKGQVFTIEPRLYVPGHGIVTLEEEVWIDDSGCEYISDPQKELWFIQ